MKLPRYFASASLRGPTLSPEQAASPYAAEAYEFQVAGQLVQHGSEVVKSIIISSDAAEAATKQQEVAQKLNAFDIMWKTTPQIDKDGNPTFPMLLEEWQMLQNELSSYGDGIIDDTKRAEFKSAVAADLQKRSTDYLLQAHQQQLSVDAAKMEAVAEAYQNAALYDLAGQVYDDMATAGHLTRAELVAKREKNEKLRALHEYDAVLIQGTDEEILQKSTDVWADPQLNADEKTKIYKRLSGFLEDREQRAEKELEELQAENSVAVWADINSYSVDQIQAFGSGLSPEMRVSMIKFKNGQLADKGILDLAGAQSVNRTLVALARGQTTVAGVMSVVAAEMTAGRVNEEFAQSVYKNIETISNAAWQDPQFNNLINTGRDIIASDNYIETYISSKQEKVAGQLKQLQGQWLDEFTQAKLQGGPAFNAGQWYTENIEEYKKRSADIISAISGKYDRYEWGSSVMYESDGSINVNATRKELREARKKDEITQQQYETAFNVLSRSVNGFDDFAR